MEITTSLSTLIEKQEKLDGLIAQGLSAHYKKDLKKISSFDFSESINDTYNLSAGKDCCYDRPSIGWTYASWYHGRRIQTALRSLARPLFENEENIHILDLGGGTGAVAWAVALIERARIEAGGVARRVKIDSVDSSPFMLKQSKRLWEEFLSWDWLDPVRNNLAVDYALSSWTETLFRCETSPWLVGAYLLDDSDKARVEEVSEALEYVAEKHAASRVILTTASSKSYLIESATETFQRKNWEQVKRPLLPAIWDGELSAVSAHRCEVYGDLDIASNDRGISQLPKWEWPGEQIVLRDFQYLGRISQPELLSAATRPTFIYDKIQDEASTPDDRATAIFGVAGSGKSRILVERIARVIEKRQKPKTQHRILVTAFNKLMVDQLADWFDERFPRDQGFDLQRSGESGDIRFKGTMRSSDISYPVSVRFLNWDKSPGRLFKIKGGSNIPKWSNAVKERVKFLQRNSNSVSKESFLQNPILSDPEFLSAELERVIYGLEKYKSFDEYDKCIREGRGKQIRSGQARKLIWALLMEDGHPRSYTHRRIEAHQKVFGNSSKNRDQSKFWETYSHLFVDEVQDFTPTDFKLFEKLIEDPHNIVTAGDITQAMHIGSSFNQQPAIKGARWFFHNLAGSYRLPVRICEALRPLAKQISIEQGSKSNSFISNEKVLLPESRKSAVLGVRPIVIGGSEFEVNKSLGEVIEYYQDFIKSAPLSREVITVAEGDPWIVGSIKKKLNTGSKKTFRVDNESMNKIKGLERPCVIWSTRARIVSDEALGEWIYTILTRTTGILIIVLSKDTPPGVAHYLSFLDKKKLLFWSNSAKDRFMELSKAQPIAPTASSA